IPTGFIASCQGFFIEAKQQGNIEFNNAMRVKTENTNFFKGNKGKDKNHSVTTEHIEKDKIWLNLYNDEGAFSQILIGFLEGATTAYESNFDGLRFSGNEYISFFSMVGNQQLAIQGVPTYRGDETISLGFSSKIEEIITLKIGIDHLEGNLKEQNIYLVDNLLSKTHNLSLNDYEFTLQQKGSVTNRFSIVFNRSILSLEDIKHTEDRLMITKSKGTIQVSTTSHSLISSILIYDILGRKLKEVKANQSKISFSSQTLGANGIYILHAKLDNSRILNKKFIK
ncbi:MAG: T9SS type A sorting domain-containing protein, partial [Flavobacteriaceae bacterium]|nr:T9SS type A sorting domain-containing protein [Flavobacteriaceae bacterium]